MYSILAVAGSKRDLAVFKNMPYDTTIKVVTPDDHGDFPDTSGYTRPDYEKLFLTNEDESLYPYMQKCLDIVDSWGNKKAEQLERLNYSDVEYIMSGHNFGGQVFAVAGIVKYTAPQIPLGRTQHVATS
jgi:hypothetical protein